MNNVKKYPKFGDKLRQLRDLKGYTQDQLAEKLGKTRAAVGSWEEGRSRPGHPVLLNIATILSGSINDFYVDTAVIDDADKQASNSEGKPFIEDDFKAILEKLVEAALNTSIAARESAFASKENAIATREATAATNKAMGMLSSSKPVAVTQANQITAASVAVKSLERVVFSALERHGEDRKALEKEFDKTAIALLKTQKEIHTIDGEGTKNKTKKAVES